MIVPIALLLLYGLSGELLAHAIGVVFGMFVSVVLLGLFRQSLNLRRANGRFADWRIASTSFATMIAVTAWILGAVNLFVVCWEISRWFTE
jgi:hypothetical protein